MKKLYTTIAVVLTLAGISMGSQLLASSQNPQPPAPAPVVPAPVMPALKELGALYLSGHELGDAGIIARAPHFPAGMRELWLGKNNIGPAGATAVAENLNRAPDLLVIDLDNNHISVDGLRALGQHLPAGLRRLFLKANNIGNAEIAALVEHSLPRKLELLNLQDNNIGDAGIIALAQSLKQNPINNRSMLKLAGNEFGDEGKHALIDAGYHEGEAGWWVRNVPAG